MCFFSDRTAQISHLNLMEVEDPKEMRPPLPPASSASLPAAAADGSCSSLPSIVVERMKDNEPSTCAEETKILLSLRNPNKTFRLRGQLLEKLRLPPCDACGGDSHLLVDENSMSWLSNLPTDEIQRHVQVMEASDRLHLSSSLNKLKGPLMVRAHGSLMHVKQLKTLLDEMEGLVADEPDDKYEDDIVICRSLFRNPTAMANSRAERRFFSSKLPP